MSLEMLLALLIVAVFAALFYYLHTTAGKAQLAALEANLKAHVSATVAAAAPAPAPAPAAPGVAPAPIAPPAPATAPAPAPTVTQVLFPNAFQGGAPAPSPATPAPGFGPAPAPAVPGQPMPPQIVAGSPMQQVTVDVSPQGLTSSVTVPDGWAGTYAFVAVPSNNDPAGGNALYSMSLTDPAGTVVDSAGPQPSSVSMKFAGVNATAPYLVKLPPGTYAFKITASQQSQVFLQWQ